MKKFSTSFKAWELFENTTKKITMKLENKEKGAL